MSRAVADGLRQTGGAVATVVTLPFRALARLSGQVSSGARRSRARPGAPRPAVAPP
ncbi:LPFR motif small protein [Streptomyces sp. NPDC006193]|uniref:LPFR motif small protein n=1 Tax=Streptomyces sp. NPDC006193 TaxID=3155717 RepID=UPI0033BE024A